MDRPLIVKPVLRILLLSVAARGEKEDSWATLQLAEKEIGRIKQVHAMQSRVTVVGLNITADQEICWARAQLVSA